MQNNPFPSDRVVEHVFQSGNPTKVFRTIVATIRVYMIDDVFFRRFWPMESGCHNDMNTSRCDFHISVCVIRFPKSPKIIIFAGPLSFTGMPKNSSVIADRIFFIFIDALYFPIETIDICHINLL